MSATVGIMSTLSQIIHELELKLLATAETEYTSSLAILVETIMSQLKGGQIGIMADLEIPERQKSNEFIQHFLIHLNLLYFFSLVSSFCPLWKLWKWGRWKVPYNLK